MSAGLGDFEDFNLGEQGIYIPTSRLPALRFEELEAVGVHLVTAGPDYAGTSAAPSWDYIFGAIAHRLEEDRKAAT